jgi:DNA-binding CsgD family transcriptional regulator
MLSSVLTARERETLAWVAKGKTYWEIGAILGVSRSGVDKRMRVMREKFGVSSQMQVVLEGVRLHLI